MVTTVRQLRYTNCVRYFAFSAVDLLCMTPLLDKRVPVTTAWLVLRIWMEERPQDVEISCEYFE